MLLRGPAFAGLARTCSTSGRAVPVASVAPVASRRLLRDTPAFQPADGTHHKQRWVASNAVAVQAGRAPPREQIFTQDSNNNVTDYIYEKMGMNLHQQPAHPIGIIKQVCPLGK